MRIVSLVPSDSYSLLRLGVSTFADAPGPRLVGRTDYCLEPGEIARVPRVGGTKNADVAAIVALAPDLVVANQEENRKKDIEELRAAGLQVLLSFPKTVGEGLEHARRLADLVGCGHDRVRAAERDYQRHAEQQREPVDTFVPIWMDPLMTIHGDTFISDALELCGGRNVFSDRRRRYPLSADLGRREPLPAERIAGRDTRYPRVTLDEVSARKPSMILLPDEPHEFTRADAAVFRELPIPARVRFCDGKDLMWYGLRGLEGLDRIAALLDEARA